MQNDTAGRVFQSRADYEEDRRKRDAILNPVKPKPKLQAIKLPRGCSIAGTRYQAGDLILVWPTQPPEGFVTQAHARELVDNLLAVPATEDELSEFLEANQLDEEAAR